MSDTNATNSAESATNARSDATDRPNSATIDRFRETIEVAAGPNVTGHEDMAAEAQVRPDPAPATPRDVDEPATPIPSSES